MDAGLEGPVGRPPRWPPTNAASGKQRTTPRLPRVGFIHLGAASPRQDRPTVPAATAARRHAVANDRHAHSNLIFAARRAMPGAPPLVGMATSCGRKSVYSLSLTHLFPSLLTFGAPMAPSFSSHSFSAMPPPPPPPPLSLQYNTRPGTAVQLYRSEVEFGMRAETEWLQNLFMGILINC